MKVKGVERGDECAICGSKENLEVHHIVPVSKGGTNEAENLAILCRRCNRRISNKIIPVIEKQFGIGQFGGDGSREIKILGGVNVLIKGTLLTKAMEVKMQREKQKGRPVSFSSVVYDAINCLYEKEGNNEEAKEKGSVKWKFDL